MGKASLLVLAGVACASCAHRRPVAPAPAAIEAPPPAPPAPPPPPPPGITRIRRPPDATSPVFGVQVDDARVYFNDGAGRLWSAPKDGAAPAVVLVGDPDDSVRSFVVEGGTIYYAARRGLRSVPVGGGPSRRLCDNPAGPILLVSDGRYLYHTVFDGSGTFRVSIATGRSERFCAGGKHQTLAVDADNLYVASYFGGTITAIAKKHRRGRVLAAHVRHPVRIAVDDRFVYFTSEDDGTVRRVGKHGGPVEIIARGQHGQEHLALDGANVYWAARTPGGGDALMRATLGAGDPPEALYRGLRSAAGLAVDAGYVYVADRGAGEVVRVAKERPALSARAP